jgi:predicted transcriptional regulator
MFADWSVECSAEDPVLVVPWSSMNEGQAGLHFVDLRENPYDLDQISEAEQYPPLMQALRALNAPRSPVFTAKCDAWSLDADEIGELVHELDLAELADHSQDDLGALATPAGFASYIDLVWRDRTVFASFHQSEQLLHRLTRLAEPLDHPSAMLDCVLRPALVDFTGAQQGYSITLYVKALGPDLDSARESWSSALEAVVGLLRSKDIALA